MKLMKPSWIHHDGHPIFAIDIHPDDTRFVTGGQGNDSVGRIVIWSLTPVLNFNENYDEARQQELDKCNPKLLCQLDHHNACVNSVRWAHSGRYLASGGDDKIIIIWRMTGKTNPNSINQGQISSSFGKIAYETWKPMNTLRNHNGDILDLSWSQDDKYLASASVDNTILIWDALKFPVVIAELKGHSSLVKGVTWDPVGKYIASQSDDKTLKIWRTNDWTEVHTVEDPFHECGGTTHVLRLDWSPDGMYLVSAHAMNGGGPTAQIVERDGWRTDKDFVGHRKAVVCVRFNSNIMNQSKIKTCCVALGSRDRSISVWSTHLKRPLFVIRDIFSKSVMDLTWSSCGRIMMACSWDGTIAAAQFTNDEIGKPLSNEEKASVQHKYFGKNINKPAASMIIQNIDVFKAKKEKEGREADSDTPQPTIPKKPDFDLMDTTLESSAVARGPIDKQIETRTADGKRRITPKFLPCIDTSVIPVPSTPNTATAVFQNTEHSNHSNLRENMVSGIDEIKLNAENAAVPMDTGPPILSNNVVTTTTADSQPPILRPEGSAPAKSETSDVVKEEVKGSQAQAQVQVNGEQEQPSKPAPVTLKRKSSDELKTPKPIKKPYKVPSSSTDTPPVPTTDARQSSVFISSSRPSQSHPTQLPPIQSSPKGPLSSVPSSSAVSAPTSAVVCASTTSSQRRRLNPLKIDGLSTTIVKKQDAHYVLEAENKSSARQYILRCQHREETQFRDLNWVVQTEAPICGVTGDPFRVIIVCEDATVHVLDLKGRYAFPPLIVSSVPSKMAHTGPYLLIVTTKATMYLWNIHAKKIIKTESVMHLLNQPGGSGNEGNPPRLIDIAHIGVTSVGIPRLILTNGKTFNYNLDLACWMLISDTVVRTSESFLEFDPSCKRTGRTSQIKLRLASAVELERKEDVKEWLIILARTFAVEGLRGELHKLCEDLLGPVHSAAKGKSSSWASTIVGVDKREVLKLILRGLRADLIWQDLYEEFTDLLEDTGTEEEDMDTSFANIDAPATLPLPIENGQPTDSSDQKIIETHADAIVAPETLQT